WLLHADLRNPNDRRDPEALADEALRNPEAHLEGRRVSEVELLIRHLVRAVADPAKLPPARRLRAERRRVRRGANELDLAPAVHPPRHKPRRRLGSLRDAERDEQPRRPHAARCALRVLLAGAAHLERHVHLRLLPDLLGLWVADELDAT